MSLPIPPLTFSTTEKGVEFLTKEQVTRLIDDVQRAHTAAITAAIQPVRDEASGLESQLKEARKLAEKASEFERELGIVRSAHDRHTTLSELLGVTDPTDISDIAAIHASRTAGVENAPTLRDWVTGHLAKPDEAPTMLQSHLAKAPNRGEQQQGQGKAQAAQRTQVTTSAGRVASPGPGNGRVTSADISKLRPGTPEWRQARTTWREQQGLPPLPEPKKEG